AEGLVIIDYVGLDEKDPQRRRRFSEKLSCPNDHPLQVDELEPRSFSFNAPYGACPECHGLGSRKEVDAELPVPDPEKTLAEGAITAWSYTQVSDYFLRLMRSLGDEMGFDVDTPWQELSSEVQDALMNGHATKVHVQY